MVLNFGLLNFAPKLRVMRGIALNIFLQERYTVRIELTVVLQHSIYGPAAGMHFGEKCLIRVQLLKVYRGSNTIVV